MLEIRRAMFRREVALELMRLLDEEPIALPKVNLPAGDTEAAARMVREILPISLETQTSWKSSYQAFSAWREAFERLGILVFHAQRIPVSEMRGVSISQEPAPVIVLNSKDSPYAKIFTLMHELCHVLLNAGGVCDLEENEGNTPDVERTCNSIAGSMLVPRQALSSHDLVRGRRIDSFADDDLKKLSSSFSVSREVILRRLLILNQISARCYKEKRAELLREYAKTPASEQFAPPHQQIISRSGPTFVRLVLSGYYQERITGSDVADYLETSLRVMPKVEQAVMGKNIEFGV